MCLHCYQINALRGTAIVRRMPARPRTPGRTFLVLSGVRNWLGFFDFKFLRDYIALIEYQHAEF